MGKKIRLEINQTNLPMESLLAFEDVSGSDITTSIFSVASRFEGGTMLRTFALYRLPLVKATE